MAGATPEQARENVWIAHRINPAPEPPKYGGYNSLVPGDFDQDGNMDILSIGGSKHDAPAEVLILWGPEAGEARNLYLDRLMIVSPPDIARPELANVLVLEAEDASIQTVGRPKVDGWNLFTEGTVAEDIVISATATYQVVVRAYGSPLGGFVKSMPQSA